jgi:hypothetical protein
MSHPLAPFALRGGDRLQLLVLWAAVIGATLIYWEACRLAHGAGTINLRDSGLWMVEIWSGWLILSFPAYELCRRWRSSAAGLSVRHVLGLMAAVSILALGCEWLLNLVLSQVGLERWDSAWAMFNRRALLCIVASSGIVAFALRPGFLQRTVERSRQSSHEVADRPRDDTATLVLTDRNGPIAVSLHDVEAILAAENYVQVCLANGKEYLHRITLAKLEQDLDARTMLRVHRSAIVNIEKVSRRWPGWRLELASGRTVRVGRTFRAVIAAGSREQ